jgi:hypothetical protein
MIPVIAFEGFFEGIDHGQICEKNTPAGGPILGPFAALSKGSLGAWLQASLSLAAEIPAAERTAPYSSGRFRSKDKPKIPVRRTSGSGAGGGATSASRGGGGAGRFSHFIEYTSLPSAVRPMGAQWSTREVTLLGTNFVCAHAGDEIRRIASTSLFIGLSRETCAVRSLLNRIGPEKSNDVMAPGTPKVD